MNDREWIEYHAKEREDAEREKYKKMADNARENPGFTEEATAPDGTKYKAKVRDDGVFEVYRVTPSEVRTTTRNSDGSITTKVESAATAPAKSFAADVCAYMDRTPIFKCACDKDSDGLEWWCDMPTGFTRWNVVKPRRYVAKVLRNCGFATAQTRKILRHCSKFEHEFLGRCG